MSRHRCNELSKCERKEVQFNFYLMGTARAPAASIHFTNPAAMYDLPEIEGDTWRETTILVEVRNSKTLTLTWATVTRLRHDSNQRLNVFVLSTDRELPSLGG